MVREGSKPAVIALACTDTRTWPLCHVAAAFECTLCPYLSRSLTTMTQAPKPRRTSINPMGLGLKLLNHVAASPVLDQLKLRKPTERLVTQATAAGFTAIAGLGKGMQQARKLLAPARLARPSSAQLFDLTPTDEQQALRDAAQDFAQQRLRPAALAADSACAAPADLLAEAQALGFAALAVPEAHGGAGSERNAVSHVLITEALAEGDMGLAVACLAPQAVATAISLWGSAGQQARYLPAFCGESVPRAALAIQEPQVLFDAFALHTKAERVTGGFRLNGEKALVPAASHCALFVIAAEIPGEGAALFIVEAGAEGLSFSPEPAMGLRAAATERLRMKDLHLPAAAILAKGTDYADCIALSRLGWCALATGTAQAVLSHVIPYTNERVAFGEPISHRQAVAFLVANIAIELEGLRLATWRAAALAEQGAAFHPAAAIARQLVSSKAAGIGSDGVQLLGGHGFTKEYPVERWYRDLRAAGFMEGVVLV